MWNEIVSRWKSPTPDFWKKMQKKGGFLLGLSVMAASVQAKYPALHIPPLIFTLSTHMGVFGFVMVIVAKLTCGDSTDNSFIGDEKEAIKKGRDSVG